MADVNANIGVNIDTSDALAQLKNLQRQIANFHNNIAKSSEQAALAQRNLQKNFLNSINAIEGFSAELKTVKTTAENFSTSLEKNKFSMREYFRYAAAASGKFSKGFVSEISTIEKTAIERVKTLQTQYIKMGRDASGAMQAIAIRPTTLNMQDLGTKTAIAAQKQAIFNQLVKQGSTNLLNFGKNTQWAGRQLMVGFTLPLATLGTTAGRVFMDMEQAALKFKKVYGDLFTAPEETQQAMDSIVELGKAYTAYGIALSDTVNLAAEAAAAGFAGVDLQNQTNAALRLSVLGQLELNDALDTTISLQNAFRISSAQLSEEINFLNAVENQTVVSLDDITTAVPKVAPVIQSLGGDVRDLAFFLAAMKEGGVNASEGANALKSGLASLINPTKVARDMLTSYGINLKGIIEANQGDLNGTVVAFAQALDTLDPANRARAIEQLFGKFQFARLSALFSNVAKDGTQASRVLDLAGASAEELATLADKELGVSAASSMNKFKKAIEDIKIALAPIGELFLQIATPIIEFGTRVLDSFNNLPGGIKKAIGTIITIIGGIGPVALMTFGLINNGIANMIKFFATVRMGYLRITGQAAGIGQETQYMTQEQLEASAAAASLDQAHANLTQRFTAEKVAVEALRRAYLDAVDAGNRFALLNPGMMKPGSPTKFASGGFVSGPGTGTSDSIPAMVSKGEAIIPADRAKQFSGLIKAIIAGDIPRFAQGTVNVGGEAYSVNARSQSTFRAIQRVIDESVGQVDDAVKEALLALASDTKLTVEKFKAEVRNIAGDQAGPAFAASDYATRTRTFNARGAGERRTVSQQLIDERGSQAAAAELDRSNAAAKVIEQKLRERGATEKQIAAAIQIDRAHVIEVNNEQKKIKEAWSSDVWVAQTGAENNLSNSLRASERNRQVYFEFLKKSGATEEQINVISDKVTRGVALNEEELVVQGNALRLLASEAQSNTQLSKQVSSNFLLYAEAVGEGQLAREAVIASQGPEVQASVVRTKETVKNGVARIANAMEQGAKEALDIASPSKKMKKAGEDAGQGMIDGAKSKIDDAQAVGEQIGQAVADGAAGGRKGPRRATSGGDVLWDTQSKKYRTQAQMADTLAKRQMALSRVAQMGVDSVGRFATRLSTASFALTSVAGVASMFGGKIGEAAGAIMQITLLMSALSAATAALTRVTTARATAELLTGLAGKRNLATGAIDAAAGWRGGAKGMAGLKNVLGNVGKVFTTFLPIITKIPPLFLKLIPIVGTIVTVGSILFGLFKNAKDDVQGLGDTANLTAEKLKGLGDIFGVTPKVADFASRFTGTTAKTSSAQSKVQMVLDSEDFQKQYKTQIDAVKKASKEDATNVLNALAIQLSAAGFESDAVEAIINAIVVEAGRKDLDLKFASINFSSEEGLASISSLAQSAADSLQGAGSKSLLDIFGLGEFSKAIQTTSGQFASIFGALKIGLQDGEITAEQFLSSIEDLNESISSLDPSKAKELVDVLSKKLEIDDKVKGIDNFQDKLLLIEATAAGIDIPSKVVQKLRAASKAGASKKDLQDAAKIRKEINELLSEELIAREEIANQEAKQAENSAQFDAATESLDEQLTVLRNQEVAYQILTERGWDAASAIEAVADSTIAAAIAGATSQDELNTLISQLSQLAELKAAQEARQPSGGGGGGSASKSPLQQAMEDLGKQRTEIKNNITAYNGLRQAGFSAAEAAEAASDATIAAALASKQVGSAEWKALVNQIRLVRVEALKTAEGIRNAFAGLKAQADEYYDILERQVERKYADSIAAAEKQIKNLGRAIDAVNKNLDDYQEQIDTLQRSITINFDRPIEALQEESSDLSHDLELIDKAADEITTRYEEQAAALEKVNQINQRLINQQKQQIGLANALSSGDIAAAAGMMQDIRAANADAAAVSQKEMLDAAKQAEIDALRSESGMSREEIEQRIFDINQEIYALEEQREAKLLEIRDIEDEIYNIQQTQLKPLEDQLSNAEDLLQNIEDRRDAELETIDAQRRKWEDAQLALDLARIKAGEFNNVIDMAKKLTGDVVTNWQKLADKTIQLTIDTVMKEIGGEPTAAAITPESGTGGGGGGRTPGATPGADATGQQFTPPVVADRIDPFSWLGDPEEQVRSWWDQVVDWFRNLPQWIAEAAGNIWSGIVTMATWLDEQWTNFESWLDNLPYNIGYAAGYLWERMQQLGDWLDEQGENLRIWLTQTVPNNIREWGRNVWANMQAVGAWLTTQAESFRTWLTVTLPTNIRNWAVNLWTVSLPTFGRWLVDRANELRDWIQSLPSRIGQWARNIWDGFWAGFTKGREDAAKNNATGGMIYRNRGGMIPKRYARGGVVPGEGNTDVVSAMLTPGEYVVNKRATAKFRPVLKAINAGTFGGGLDVNRYKAGQTSYLPSEISGGIYNIPSRNYADKGTAESIYKSSKEVIPSNFENSVYNYNLSVNVNGTDADPNDIANTVMSKLRRIDSQRLRNQVI